MKWRPFPDAQYVPDHDGSFARHRSVRLVLRVMELARFMLLAILTLSILALGMILILVWNANAWLVIGSGIVVMFCLTRLLMKTMGIVPLRCSSCRRFMRRSVRDVGDEKHVVYYTCSHCKRYIDLGIGEIQPD